MLVFVLSPSYVFSPMGCCVSVMLFLFCADLTFIFLPVRLLFLAHCLVPALLVLLSVFLSLACSVRIYTFSILYLAVALLAFLVLLLLLTCRCSLAEPLSLSVGVFDAFAVTAGAAVIP